MKKFPWHAHQIFGWLVALFGALIVFRWIFQNETITRLIPGSAEMELNAPLLFLAAGVYCALYPLHQTQPKWRAALLQACGWLLLLLPGLTLVEHLFQVDLGIDFVRGAALPTESRPHPGRLAPNTTLAFLSIGLGFQLMRRPPDRREWQIAAAIALAMLTGFAALAGYFLGLETLYHVTSFNRMLLPTAAGISVLSIGVWLLLQRRLQQLQRTTASYQRRITRRAITVLTLVALSAGIAGFAVMRVVFEKALSQNILLAATTNAASLVNQVEDKLAFHQTIATRPIVQEHFARLQKAPQDPEALEFLQATARNLMTTGLSGTRLLDAESRPVAASGTLLHSRASLVHRLVHAGPTAYLAWHDGYLLHTENKVVAAGRTVGTIIVEQRLPAFDKLLQHLQDSSASTDALLCSRRQEAAVCAPSRFNRSVFTIPLSGAQNGMALPVGRALEGWNGVMSTKDLRKTAVFAAYTPLQEIGLGMVVTVDADTLYAPLKDQVQLLAALLVALVAVGTITLRLAVRPLLDHIVRDKNRINALLEKSRRAEEKLAGSERRLRAITDNLPVLISYIDREYKFRFCNKTYEEWLGVPAAGAIGRHVADAIGPTLYEERRANLERALAGEKVESEVTSTALGVERHLHSTYVPDIAPDGSVAGIYTLSTDVSALKAVERELQRMARFDALTGLPNRYQMNEKLAEAIMRSRRSGAAMAVMFLDVDRFKSINDSIGHAGGDEVLKEFGRRLKASVRQTDTVCRLAGDEFLVILEQPGNPEDAGNIARKVIANIGAPCEIQGQPLHIGTSIGIAFCHGQPPSPDALVDLADQALYEAKQAGRGTFRMMTC